MKNVITNYGRLSTTAKLLNRKRRWYQYIWPWSRKWQRFDYIAVGRDDYEMDVDLLGERCKMKVTAVYGGSGDSIISPLDQMKKEGE